jgi:hypothetical protein
MKILAILGMVAGGSLALLVLRVFHAQWGEFVPLLLTALVSNALAGLLAYALFHRTATDAGAHRMIALVGYVFGVIAGVYLYYT